MKATFGEYIRKLRNNKGLTLTELAAKLKPAVSAGSSI